MMGYNGEGNVPEDLFADPCPFCTLRIEYGQEWKQVDGKMYHSTCPATKSEVDAALRSEGLDPDDIGKRGQLFVGMCIKLAKAQKLANAFTALENLLSSKDETQIILLRTAMPKGDRQGIVIIDEGGSEFGYGSDSLYGAIEAAGLLKGTSL
jgi:hypothetical protein